MPFAFINLIMLFLCAYIYGSFRFGVEAYCRVCRRMSKTMIRKNKKGASNFWLYTQLHKQKNLGKLYGLNFICLVSLASFTVATFFSWVPFLKIPVIIIGIFLGVTAIPAYFMALIYLNMEEFGRKFVLFKVYKGYNGKSRQFASAVDWLFCVLPLVLYIFMLLKCIE